MTRPHVATSFLIVRVLEIAASIVWAWLIATAAADAREWPSAPFQGQDPRQPPCICRTTSGKPVELGREACLVTPAGAKRARCVLVLNNTSWQIASEDCQPDLTN